MKGMNAAVVAAQEKADANAKLIEDGNANAGPDVDVEAIVADSIAIVDAELNAVGEDLTKVSEKTAGIESIVEQMQAKQAADAKTIADLLKTNKQLTDGLVAVQKELKDVVASIPSYTPAQCDTLQDPDNGSVDWIGDHGDSKVPVSVTATFSCKDGFFLDSDDSETTCNHVDADDGSSSGAAWTAPGKHPGCKACSKDCAKCMSADKCDACAEGALLVDDACTVTPGLTRETAAESCLAIVKASPNATSRGAGYWIKLPDGGERKMFCFMVDWDAKNGGGWTMVGRGIGGNPGCWNRAGDNECNPTSMWDTRKSFLYSDSIINGIPHDTIWYQGYGTIKSNFYFKADDGECEYKHKSAASAECICPHAEADFSDECPTGEDSDNHYGVGGWNTVEGSDDHKDGWLHTSYNGGNWDRNPSWFIRKNDCKGRDCDAGGFCRGNTGGCNVGIYVR